MAVKSPADRLRERVARVMRKNVRWAATYIDEQTTRKVLADGTVVPAPWEERLAKQKTMADAGAIEILKLHEAAQRADKLAARPTGLLGVVVLPGRAASIDEWEAEGKKLEAESGRHVIDTTAGPVLPPVPPPKQDE